MSKEPLYPRVLRLRHIHPSGWQRLLFWEGSFVVAALLVLADVASAWTLLALPAGVALVVKANDLLAGLLAKPPMKTGPSPALRRAAHRDSRPVPAFGQVPAVHRNDLTAEVTGHFEGLTEQALQLARALLEDQGSFLPFACALGRNGRRATAGLQDLCEDVTDRAHALEMLHRGLISERHELEAVGVVADAQSGNGEQDVVLVELGHRQGPSLLLLAPYSLDMSGDVRIATFGQPSAMASAPSVFGVQASEPTA